MTKHGQSRFFLLVNFYKIIENILKYTENTHKVLEWKHIRFFLKNDNNKKTYDVKNLKKNLGNVS